MNPKVRRATAADAPGLYRAWEALRQYNASLDPRIQPLPVTAAEFAAGLRESLGRPNSAAFIAERASTVIGFSSGTIQPNQPDRLPERLAVVGYLYVVPQERRNGLGRQLFEFFAEWARGQEGVSHVEMPVLAGDVEASAFWQSLGFRPFIQRLWAPLLAEDGP
jgi:GNAT superfamily N-acetyltransferase